MKKATIICLISLILFSCSKERPKIYLSEDYSVEERVEDLLSRMTLEEKVSQMRMFHANLGIELSENGEMLLSDDVKKRLTKGIAGIKNPGEFLSPENAAKLNNQLQQYIIENNRFGIPALFVTESYNGVDATGCTRFGRPITLSSSWNTELVKKVYDICGREARLRGLHMTHSPVADMARDPRFGRMSESFGEDTHLCTEMIVSAVSGLQGEGDGLNKTHIGAVTKHFAGYAQVAGGLNFASVEISPRTLSDEILPPFKAAVQRAGTLGIMASHGDLNGVASHANYELLTEILRNDWGFKGYVVSDANDIARLHFFMKVAETPEEAVILGLEAGMDVDLYSDEAYALLPELVKTHPGLEEYIDRSASRVLRTKFVLGLFDHPFVDSEAAKIEVRNQKAIELANQSDMESVILLKNEQNLLPLSTEGKKKIALVGPLLNGDTRSGFESVTGDAVRYVTEKGFSLTNGQESIPELSSPAETKRGMKRILEKSKDCDLVILYVGGDEYTAKEAFFNGAIGDRDNIHPVGQQDQLLMELKKLGIPVVVVLKHRRTLAIKVISEYADAILDCWDLSEFGDLAIARILFGEAIPSGKLPVTVARSTGQLPIHYSQKEINSKKGYLFTENSPLYPFGFGLSYTEFSYSDLELSPEAADVSGSGIKVSVQVTNTGDYAGKEVVQLYIKDLYGTVLRPDKELKAFEKIELKPGESRLVTFTISPDMLEFTGMDMQKTVEAGEYQVMVGGSSDKLLSANFELMP